MAKGFGEVDYRGLEFITKLTANAQDRAIQHASTLSQIEEDDRDKKLSIDVTNAAAEAMKTGDRWGGVMKARQLGAAGGKRTQEAIKGIHEDVKAQEEAERLRNSEIDAYIRAAGGNVELGLKNYQAAKENIEHIRGVYAQGRTETIAGKPFPPKAGVIPGEPGNMGWSYDPNTGQWSFQPTGNRPKQSSTGTGQAQGMKDRASLAALSGTWAHYKETIKDPKGPFIGKFWQIVGELGLSDDERAVSAVAAQDMHGMVATMAIRIMGGERGVTTDRDTQRGSDLIPKITEPPAIVARKIQNIEILMEARKKAVEEMWFGRIDYSLLPDGSISVYKVPAAEATKTGDMTYDKQPVAKVPIVNTDKNMPVPDENIEKFSQLFGFYPQSYDEYKRTLYEWSQKQQNAAGGK